MDKETTKELSIIIPAKNEEEYLPRLLKSIREQNFPASRYEVIVADANSSDKTVEVAKSYNCKVVKGGMPAVGRNAGAKEAVGKIFLFVDADSILPKRFIESAVKEFKEKKLTVASVPVAPITDKKKIKMYFDFLNDFIMTVENFLPYGSIGIMASSAVHQKIKGFNEELVLCEDHDYVRRAAKLGKFRVLRSAYVSISLRRYHNDGWLKVLSTYIFAELYNDFLGPIKSDFLNYKFGHYSKKTKEKDSSES